MSKENTTLILTTQISDWIYQLYQGAASLAQPAFKQWCFTHVQSLFEFDTGLWVSRSDMAQKQNFHWADDTFLFKQPVEFITNYSKIDARADSIDLLNQRLADNTGKFFAIWDCCPKEIWYQSDFYQEHCIEYGIENAISAMMCPSKYSDITHIVSFYRKNVTAEFTAAEKSLANYVFPHLLQAYSANLLASFNTQSKKSVRGVLDRFGKIIVAEEGFQSFMVSKGLCEQSNVTLTVLNDLTNNMDLEVAGVTLALQFQDGLIYIDAVKPRQVDKLSARQKEICELMVKGYENSDIAHYLKIKVPTVNNHVQNIFKILGINSRAAVAQYLIRQGFC